MAYNYRLSEEAEADVRDSYLWYEQQKVDLGEEFLMALDAAEKTIVRNPRASRIRFKKKVRAHVVDRFPYLILYIIEQDDINVISVFNTPQHPGKWKQRIK